MTMQTVTQLLCALSLYGGVVQMLLAWFGISVPVLLPLAFCVAGAGVCRGLRPRAWRWAGLALLAPAALFCRDLWTALALLPMLGFAAYTGLAEPAPVEHDAFLRRFRISGMVYGVLLAASGLSGALVRCEPALALLFFFSGVLLLRLSRYDAHTLGDRRFRALNAGALGVVCLAGAVLSDRTVLGALGKGIGAVYRTCLAPLLTVFFSILAWLFGWVAWLVGRLLPGVEETEMPPLDAMMIFGEEPTMPEGAQAAQTNPLLRAVLVLLGAAALAAVAFVLLRLLWKYARPAPVRQQGKEVREALPGNAAERRGENRAPRFGSRRAVRQAYARALRLLAANGVGLAAGETSADMLEKTQARFGDTAAGQLRQLYLPARYCGTHPVTQAEAKAAKDAVKQLKKELGSH